MNDKQRNEFCIQHNSFSIEKSVTASYLSQHSYQFHSCPLNNITILTQWSITDQLVNGGIYTILLEHLYSIEVMLQFTSVIT